jgi:hypothetical protein
MSRGRDIELVHSRRSASATTHAELEVASHPKLKGFAVAADRAGMSVTDAVRLAIERDLVLTDASHFGLDAGGARYLLTKAARRTRPLNTLSAASAEYARSLRLRPRRRKLQQVHPSTRVAIPARLLTRAEGKIRLAAFDEAAIEEMVEWECAATLSGCTLAEWAFKALLAAQRAA